MSETDSALPGGQVVLYSRPGCHLCEEARDALLTLHADGLRFELHEVDIESSEILHRKLLELIPVVEVDGVRVSELMFDDEAADALRARLGTVQA